MFVWMFWCVVSQHAQHQQLRTNAGRDRNDTPTQLTRNFALRPQKVFLWPKNSPDLCPKTWPRKYFCGPKSLIFDESLERYFLGAFWATFWATFRGPLRQPFWATCWATFWATFWASSPHVPGDELPAGNKGREMREHFNDCWGVFGH